jgi:hypothetical protein
VTRSDLEVAESVIEAFGDEDVERIMPLIHPDFEATTPPGLAAEPDTYRGHDGVRRYFASFYDAVDKIWLEVHESRQVGGKVLIHATLHSRGRSTGIEAGIESYLLWTIKDEQVLRAEIFATEAEALAATEGSQSGGGQPERD